MAESPVFDRQKIFEIHNAKNKICETHTHKYTLHMRMKPPVFTRDKICKTHNINAQCKYTMQLHKWLESPIFARQKICEICAWSLAAWILDFAFAQSVVF